jgi:hypothetical protein
MPIKLDKLSDDVWVLMDGSTILAEIKDSSIIIRGTLKYGADLISPSASELAAIDGLTASATELNFNDGSSAGSSIASKTLVLGADKNTDVLALPVSGLKIGTGGGTAVARTAAELNLITQGVAAGYKIARGIHTTVDEDDTVATGLATVVAVVVSLESDPVSGAAFVTGVVGNQAGAPAAGSIQIKTFELDLTAGTTFSKLVNWIAIGT